ncbi:MAG: vanadium-dependent haloperoxidase [Verrucomicrobiia bacterium]
MKIEHYSLAPLMAAALSSLAPSASADVITDWNLITVNATKVAPALNSNLGSRIDAIEAVAVYDAVNSIQQFGTPYHYYAPNSGSAQAAAAQAAHDVLVHYFPGQQAALDTDLTNSLINITDGPIGNGQTVGSAAAADIVALRASDGSSPNVTYPGPGTIVPGAYQLTPNSPTVASNFTFAAGINEQWGTVTPFVLTHGSQFRPPPPPTVANNNRSYVLPLNQVKTYGATNSPNQTPAQVKIAQFYKQDAELTVNEAARDLALANNLPLANDALLFALVDIAVADSRIAIWDAKYAYLYWRPVTALNANPDGTVTNGYTAWTPTIVTPNHPDYPSGHSGTVTAGAEVLAAFFGDANTFTLHTTTAGQSSRTLTSLTQLEQENGLSRIYGGIHYSFDNLEGQGVGALVAAYTLANGPHANP